ncbi:MAG TPA: VOC family protein [Acidimicrobiales bacterium]|jgi:hypothetical protein
MATVTNYDNGMPCWVDCMVTSHELHHDKRAFLSALFDWTWDEGSPDTSHYALAFSNGQPVMGLGIDEGATTANFLTYFSTDDIESSIAGALELGASSLLPVLPVMDMGSMTVMNDPEGATFGLWQPGTFPGFGVVYEDNAPGWFDHVSRNPERAAEFYASARGHEVVSPDAEMRILKNGEQWYASISNSPVDEAPQWRPLYLVDSLERVHEVVRRHGGTVLIEEMPVPGSAISTFIEPVTGTTMSVARAGNPEEASNS